MYYIVTDSSTDMPQSWVEAQHDFHIVSLSCTINGVSPFRERRKWRKRRLIVSSAAAW